MSIEPSRTLFFQIYFLVCVCVCVFCLHVCVCTMGMSDAHGGEQRALALLELDLQMVVSCHVGAGNRTWILCEIRCSYLAA